MTPETEAAAVEALRADGWETYATRTGFDGSVMPMTMADFLEAAAPLIERDAQAGLAEVEAERDRLQETVDRVETLWLGAQYGVGVFRVGQLRDALDGADR